MWHPKRTIEIVAGTPPGGGLDRTARALALALDAKHLVDVPIHVTNLTGDGSRKVWPYMDDHARDPHVLAISSPNVTTDNLTGLTAFDHAAYTPLAILHNEYIAFVVHGESPLQTASALLERLGGNTTDPIKVALATSLGNPNHIALAQVNRHAGGESRRLKVRAFDSARYAVADIIAGSSELGVISAASAVPELTSGILRALAVSAPERLPAIYQHTPTWVEQGVGCLVGAWRGVNGAAGLDKQQIGYWDTVLAAAVATDEWSAATARNYWSPMHVDSTRLPDYLRHERAQMQAVLSDLGLIQ